jgi:hypothetical protein
MSMRRREIDLNQLGNTPNCSVGAQVGELMGELFVNTIPGQGVLEVLGDLSGEERVELDARRNQDGLDEADLHFTRTIRLAAELLQRCRPGGNIEDSCRYRDEYELGDEVPPPCISEVAAEVEAQVVFIRTSAGMAQ